MARPLRIEYEGAFYHITARGNERNTIFYDKTDYEGKNRGQVLTWDKAIEDKRRIGVGS
jgi:hypothetical protein